jgi:hypothetical protein
MTDLRPNAPIATLPIAFVMLPGAGPACEGDDCLPAATLDEASGA